MDLTTLAAAMAWLKKQPDNAAASAAAAEASAEAAAESAVSVERSTSDDVKYIIGG